jgi:3-dehydroquinate synthetase
LRVTSRGLGDVYKRQGFAEVIKYGLIRDAAFFAWLEQNAQRVLSRDAQALPYAIRRCCELKAEVVGIDERENGLRAILNFGHTFGHAIENALGYGEWLHGEAVAAGMILAADMSMRLGYLSATDYQRTVKILTLSGLPVKAPPIGVEKARDLMSMDKKVHAGQLRLVLLQGIGNALITDQYPAETFTATLQHGFAKSP